MKVKAKPKESGVPREVKSWRLDVDILKKLASFCKKQKKAESEVIEDALYDYLNR